MTDQTYNNFLFVMLLATVTLVAWAIYLVIHNKPVYHTDESHNSAVTQSRIIRTQQAKGLFRDRAGVTALEYGIVAGVLGLVLISIFKGFGSTLTGLFHTIGTSI